MSLARRVFASQRFAGRESAPLYLRLKTLVQDMTIVIEGAAAISKLGHALLVRGAKRLCLMGGLATVYPPYLDADVRAGLVMPETDAMDGAIMLARRNQKLPERWP